MKNFILVLAFIISLSMFSQGTCSTPEESLVDLNSIAKCSVKSSTKESKDKKSRQISVRVSASKKRYLKKRKVVQKKSIASSANNLNGAGISETGHSTGIDNSLALNKEEENTDSFNIADLTNSLSAEEVRKANKFSTVDKIPTFNACKSAKKKDRLSCFNTEMIKHIQKHFNYPTNAVINKIEGEVWVRFIIDKEGDVTNIKAMGPQGGKILDGEAIRVVSKLAKFIPGEKEGKRTPVKYGFPIAFSLED